MTQKRKVFSRPESSVLLTCKPIHSPPIYASRWRAQKWDLFCLIYRGKNISSNITMKHSEGEEDRSWESVPFKQKWKCFPTFPIPTSHVCWSWRSALLPFSPSWLRYWHTQKIWVQNHGTRLWTHFTGHLMQLGHQEKWPQTPNLKRRKGKKNKCTAPHTRLPASFAMNSAFPGSSILIYIHKIRSQIKQ